jgi:hypothetical protein
MTTITASQARRTLADAANTEGLRIGGDAIITFQLEASKRVNALAERVVEVAKERIANKIGNKKVSSIDIMHAIG